MAIGLDKAILEAGGRDALAERLGVHANTIRYWETHRIPVKRLAEVERITGIPRRELRADLWEPS
jgi:DNA-binding transcriptional regulator YdaS (Cro superfamily)